MNKEELFELDRIWNKIFITDRDAAKQLTLSVINLIFQTKSLSLFVGIKLRKNFSKRNSVDSQSDCCLIVPILQNLHQYISELSAIKLREKMLDWRKLHSMSSSLENSIISQINDLSDYIENKLQIADMIDEESINRTINFVLEQLSELTQETEYNIFSQDSKLLNITEISKIARILVSFDCGYQEFYEFPVINDLNIHPKSDHSLKDSMRSSLLSDISRKYDEYSNLKIESLPQILIFSIPDSCSIFKLYEQLLDPFIDIDDLIELSHIYKNTK